MCSSVWSRLSPVFSWKFACYLYPLQHDSTLKKTFHSTVFFEIWNGNEKPKKKSQKRELGKDKWYSQMEQVGTGWSTWNKWDRDRGVPILGGTRWDWDRSLFDLSLSQWDRFGTASVTVTCACTTWYLIKNRSQKSVFLMCKMFINNRKS